MQFWLFSYNPGPLAQSLAASCPSLCVSFPVEQQRHSPPCRSQISLGRVRDGKHQCGDTEAERGSREEKIRSGRNGNNVSRLGTGRNPTPPQHQTGLKASAVPVLCFKPAGVGWWPGCPPGCGDTGRAGVSAAPAAEVPAGDPSPAPGVMGAIPCEWGEWKNGKFFRKKEYQSSACQCSGITSVSSTLFWSLQLYDRL